MILHRKPYDGESEYVMAGMSPRHPLPVHASMIQEGQTYGFGLALETLQGSRFQCIHECACIHRDVRR